MTGKTAKKATSAAQNFFGLVEKATVIAEPFVPYLSQAFLICKVISDVVETLTYLKESNERLTNYIISVNDMLCDFGRTQVGQPGLFSDQGPFSTSFERYIIVLMDMQAFIIKISNKSTFRRILRGTDYVKKFEQLENSLHDASKVLTIAVNFCILGNQGKAEAQAQQIISGIEKNYDEIKTTRAILNKEITYFIDQIDNNLVNVTDQLKAALAAPKAMASSETVKMLADKAMVNANDVKDIDGVKMFYGSLVDEVIHYNPKKRVANIKREIGLLRSVSDCPYIRHCYGMYQKDDDIVILYEYAEKRNLHDLMTKGRISWRDRWTMSFDIAQAISFLHRNNIIHHDIRAENVVVTSHMQAKLANFSVSRYKLDVSVARSNDSTAHFRWLAPERLVDSQVEYTTECEVYSFGTLLWELAECNGKLPYEDIKDNAEIPEHVVKGSSPKITVKIPPALEDIMMSAWKREPSERPKAAEISIMLLQKRDEISNFTEEGDPAPSAVEPAKNDALEFCLSDEEPETKRKCRDAKKFFDESRFEDAWVAVKPFVDSNEATAEGYYCAAMIVQNGNAKQEKDAAKAREWFKMAADQGHPEGQYWYARHLEGSGERDEAFKNFLGSAEQWYRPAITVIIQAFKEEMLGQKKNIVKVKD